MNIKKIWKIQEENMKVWKGKVLRRFRL